MSHNPPQYWASEKIFTEAGGYYDSLCSDIAAASVTVDLVVYIFILDDVGHRLAEFLHSASERGVRVRLLLDGFGSLESLTSLNAYFQNTEVEIRIFHPLFKFAAVSLSNTGHRKGRFDTWLRSVATRFYLMLSSLNLRDHRKLCVIDQKIAWVGSLNVCRSHVSLEPPWRDYAVRVTGASIALLQENFDAVWSRRVQRLVRVVKSALMSTSSLRQRLARNRRLIRLISDAEQRIWICNAYFSPSNRVLKALVNAAGRGVDVSIVVAGRSDVTFFPLLISTYYHDLLYAGVSVYAYRAGILHAKAMMVDCVGMVGSSNFNHRSFYHDLELDVLLNDPSCIRDLEAAMRDDIELAQRVVPEDGSIWRRSVFFGWFLRIFRYWM